MTTAILDALSERIARQAWDVVIQPAGVGPWTAYYVKGKLVVLARPAAAGPTGAIEVALMPLENAGVIRKVEDLDTPFFAGALEQAVRLAPTMPSRSAADFGGPTGWAALDGLLLIVTTASWIVRRRAEARDAHAASAEEGLEVLNAARGEANLRANSLLLGFVAAVGMGILATVAVVSAGALLVAAGVSSGLALALWLLVLIAPSFVFWKIRRRWPSAPQRPIDRLGRDLVGLIILLCIGLVVVSIVGGPH